MANTDKCVFIDFEAKSELSIEHGAFAYCAHPSTDFLMISFAIEDQDPVNVTHPHSLDLNELFQCINAGYKIVAHNMLFEIAMFKYVMIPRYRWPMPKLEQWLDTMHLAGRAGLPLGLGDAAKALNITEKLEEGKDLIKMFCVTPFVDMDSRPKDKMRFIEYCNVDTLVSRDIWRNLPELKDSEIEDIQLDLQSNLHGVLVDTELSETIYNNVLDIQESFGNRVSDLTNGVITKMTQVQRIKKWMHDNVNNEIPNCAADTISDIISGVYGSVDERSMEILEMRQHSGKSSTGKYYRYVNSSVDSTIYGMIISFGAHTGRTISKLLNLNNLPKPSIKYESMDTLVEDMRILPTEIIDEKYGSYLKAASTAIRGMITARPGKILAIADYASIEARLVFWLANCKTGLRKYYNGIDLYKDQATTIFHTSYDRVNDDQRWLGKQVILGAGFGLGWKGFIGSCARWGVEVSDDIAQKSIAAYREDYPEVVDMWDDLDRKSIMACKTGQITYACNGRIAFKTFKTKSGVKFLLMKLPSGRFLMYPHVKVIMATTPWGSRRVAISYKKFKDGRFVSETTYGGKLSENAIQAIARDLMYYGARNARDNDYDILFSVYDEIIAEVDESKADIKLFESLICKIPDWGLGIPLEAEGKLLKHYQKL